MKFLVVETSMPFSAAKLKASSNLCSGLKVISTGEVTGS